MALSNSCSRLIPASIACLGRILSGDNPGTIFSSMKYGMSPTSMKSILEINEADMLKQTEYYDRWRFDYRLYRPIVQFAKDKGIALYCRATAGTGGETVVRRGRPTRAGGAVGVASEKGLVQISTRSGGLEALRELLAHLEEHDVPGKELQFRSPGEGSDGHASLVLSRENLHDLPSVVSGLEGVAGGVTLREGVGAVSAIGSGINASFSNLRKALDAAAAVEAAVLGISTSSFRISVLVEERHLPELTRRFHTALVGDD